MKLLWSKRRNPCLLHALANTKQIQFCRELCSNFLTQLKLKFILLLHQTQLHVSVRRRCFLHWSWVEVLAPRHEGAAWDILVTQFTSFGFV